MVNISFAEKNHTFYGDVYPVFAKKCLECHGTESNQIKLDTYENARPWAKSIAKVLSDGAMPPWFADPNHGIFSNERKLSDEEKSTIINWVNSGAAKGDESLSKDIQIERRSVKTINKPDLTISMEEDFIVPATGIVDYQHIRMNPNFTEDKWVSEMEIKPGNLEVVHHIIVFIKSEDGTKTMLGGWAPGLTPFSPPPNSDMGFFIPSGSEFIFQMHYTPNGTEQKDRSSLRLKFRKTPPKNVINISGIFNFRLNIPKNDPNHYVSAEKVFNEDTELISLMPHMHLRGKSFKYTLIRSDGSTEILLSVPKYSFEWQLHYDFVNPVLIRKGEKIICEAVFDNSSNNPDNPDPNIDVKWGEQSWQEMMIGWYTEIKQNKIEFDGVVKEISEKAYSVEALVREQRAIKDEFKARYGKKN
jgi:hypothetical protein